MTNNTDVIEILPRGKALEDQRVARLKLLENGYAPLPATEKRVLLKGWPAIQATPEMIEAWALHSNALTTAIRIENGLIALDVDIMDEVVCDQVMSAIKKIAPDFYRNAPLRNGKASKVMLLGRIDEPFKIMSSASYIFEGDAGQKIECFGGNVNHYFTILGPHTEGAMTSEGVEVLIRYDWEDDRGPTEVRADELPVITKDQVMQICLAASDIMEAAGWDGDPGQKRFNDAAGDRHFDLTDDMVFQCGDGVSRSLDEMQECDNMPLSASFFTQASTPTRCRCHIHHDGVVSIIDYNDHSWHYPEGYEYKTPTDVRIEKSSAAMRQLGELIKLNPEKMGVIRDDDVIEFSALTEEEAFEAKVLELLAEWAHFPSGAPGEQVVSLLPRPRQSVSLPAFKLSQRRHSIMVRSTTILANGDQSLAQKSLNPVDVWCDHNDLIAIEGKDYVPEIEDTVVHDHGFNYRNTYKAPDFGNAEIDPAHVDLWVDFLTHLIPDDGERAWFENWLAYKVQHPSERGVAVLLVSNLTQGTGRGTLYNLITAIVGSSNVSRPTIRDLNGKGGDFNQWLGEKLFGLVDEVLSEGDSMKDKKASYDHLKSVFDPATSEVAINIKNEKLRMAKVRLSTIMATNHVNALPLHSDDRRVACLSTPNKLNPEGALFARLLTVRNAGKVDDAFALTIRDRLLRMATLEDDFMLVPPTAARDLMISESYGVIGDLLSDVLAGVGKEYAAMSYVVAKLENVVKTRGYGTGMLTHVRADVKGILRGGFDGWKLFDKRVDVGKKDSKLQLIGRQSRAALLEIPLSERSPRVRVG